MDLNLTLDGTLLSATLVAGTHGYELHDGTLCGYILGAQIFQSLNAFVDASCGCLGLAAPLIVDYDTPMPSCTMPTAATCDPADWDRRDLRYDQPVLLGGRGHHPDVPRRGPRRRSKHRRGHFAGRPLLSHFGQHRGCHDGLTLPPAGDTAQDLS
jgi:hypothetical protein